MTIALAHDYIRRRMEELGHGDHYYLRFRHFVLLPRQHRTVQADNELFILVEPNDAITVLSSFGVFDVTADDVNELQYEHQGTIQLNNLTHQIQHVRFIQVILK